MGHFAILDVKNQKYLNQADTCYQTANELPRRKQLGMKPLSAFGGLKQSYLTSIRLKVNLRLT